MTIRETILEIVKDQFKTVYGVPCTVKSVNSSERTCDCSPINDDADILDVRLLAGDGNGLTYIPKVGSVVIVKMISDVSGFVAMFSQLDNIQFLDGSFGGLTKTPELKTQLDKTKEVVDAIKDSLTNWTTVPNDGGAALKTFFAGQIAGKDTGDYSDIENDKITHGNP